MAREFDVVVLGATGFTGVYVAKELLRKHAGRAAVRVGLAARNLEKLRGAAASIDGADGVPLLVADTSNKDSLHALAKRTRALISCVGPFRFHGRQVVEACIREGTHYLDITGEPNFIEDVLVRYHEEAQEKRVFAVPSCGFDCVPAEIGTAFVRKTFKEKYPRGALSTIEAFLTAHAPKGHVLHYATYESAVHGIGTADQLRANRKVLRSQQTLDGKIKLKTVGPKLQIKGTPYYEDREERWSMLFPGADASVVKNTFYLEAQREYKTTGDTSVYPQHAAYFTIPSFFYMCMMCILGCFAGLMTKCQCGRNLLLRYPGFFTAGVASHDGATEEQLQAASFEMDFHAKGYPDADDTSEQKAVEMHCKFAGPEPGYHACSIFVVECTLCLLENEEAMLSAWGGGGVLTPGAAFGAGPIVDKLRRNRIALALEMRDLLRQFGRSQRKSSLHSIFDIEGLIQLMVNYIH